MRRRTLRLRDFNYSSARGYYFTSCVTGREHLFGSVGESELFLNSAGQMVRDIWNKLPERFPSVTVDEFIVMPDHVHGIILLDETRYDQQGVGAGLAPPILKKGAPRDAPTLGQIVGAFKSITAKSINTLLGRTGPVWQRNYYERVIRNEEEWNALRRYIRENPLRWTLRQNALKHV